MSLTVENFMHKRNNVNYSIPSPNCGPLPPGSTFNGGFNNPCKTALRSVATPRTVNPAAVYMISARLNIIATIPRDPKRRRLAAPVVAQAFLIIIRKA